MNKRNTIQKQMILNAVMDMKSHVTADEVYMFLNDTHPQISKGTVYRNLGVLADEHKIRRVETTNGPDRFDFNLFKHYHVSCIQCGNVFDVDMDEVEDLTSRIRDTHGMEFLDYDILFKGICPECRNMEKEA